MRPTSQYKSTPNIRSGRKTSIGRSLAILALPMFLLMACDDDGSQVAGANSAVSRDYGSPPVAKMMAPSQAGAVWQRSSHTASDQAAPPTQPEEERTLAYRHEIEARAAISAVADVISGMASYCQELPGCVVMEQVSRRVENDYAHGSFTARALPEDIPKLEQALEAQGGDVTIEARVTTAEDMEGPITDAERRLSMLRQQRDQLERLQSQAGDSIDHLIRIGQQLSQVQANIEMIEGQRERLRQQVERELWTLRVTSRPTASGTVGPIYSALKSVPANFSSAVAMLIVFLAYTLPWVMVLVPALWGLRAWLRKRKERKQVVRRQSA